MGSFGRHARSKSRRRPARHPPDPTSNQTTASPSSLAERRPPRNVSPFRQPSFRTGHPGRPLALRPGLTTGLPLSRMRGCAGLYNRWKQGRVDKVHHNASGRRALPRRRLAAAAPGEHACASRLCRKPRSPGGFVKPGGLVNLHFSPVSASPWAGFAGCPTRHHRRIGVPLRRPPWAKMSSVHRGKRMAGCKSCLLNHLERKGPSSPAAELTRRGRGCIFLSSMAVFNSWPAQGAKDSRFASLPSQETGGSPCQPGSASGC